MANVTAPIGAPCILNNELRLRYNRFSPTPEQTAFLATTGDEALFGGQAGAGKSETLLNAAAMFADVPGYNALLFRRTLQDLKLPDGLIPMSKAMWSNYADYNANDYKWTFPSTATIQFGYMKEAFDHLRYQGVQVQYIGWDELTQFPLLSQYEYLFSRLRRPSLSRPEMLAYFGSSPDGLTLADIPLRVRAATNPGGPGAHWVKQRFIDPETATAPFLPASFRSNPAINPEEYARSLSRLSEVERRRLELGDWDVVEVDGALWAFEDIQRVDDIPRDFDVVAVGVDGAVSEGTGDECGIVAGGIADGVVTVLEDASIKAHPDEWAKRAVLTYHHHGATRLVIEANQGGEMNKMILNNAADALGLSRPHVLLVRAGPGESKELRAQPVAQAYRAGKVVHAPEVRDSVLEAQMCSWIPGDKKSVKSPDRVDALVWMVNHLMFGAGGRPARKGVNREAMSTWQQSGRRQRVTALG